MHREANHRLAFHSNCSAASGDSVCVVADDTDVYILLLFISNQANGTIYFRQGTSSSKQGITYHNFTAFANELGNNVCNVLLTFHAPTGSGFTRTFYRKSKIQSFKKLMKTPSKNDLLRSLQTKNAIVSEVVDFVIHIIYNLPNHERLPGDSRYAMLFVKRGNKKVFASFKTLIPDVDSLTMKIKRANLVPHSWKKCLNSEYEGLHPLLY